MTTREEAIAVSDNSLLQAQIILPLAAFAVPFLVAGPQWLTGTLVNCFLFVASVKLARGGSRAVIILPSVAALLHGALFGPFTPFLLYFLPFIWLGNYVLVSLFASLRRIVPSFLAVLFSALLKAMSLYLFAALYVHFHVVPSVFLTSMGLIQLLTALVGGALALGILPFMNGEA